MQNSFFYRLTKSMTGGYKVYFSNGLVIRSQVVFPELQEISDDRYDVLIQYGEVPKKLENSIDHPMGEIANGEFLLDAENVARYWVQRDNLVVVEPYEHTDSDAVRLYLLSTVFGLLLHKSDILPLHAACVKIGDGAFLVAGRSGIGKSTLALGLYELGYEVLNDDISGVSFKEGTPVVFPGYVHLKVWANSLEKYGYNTGEFRKLRKNYDKYSFPISRAEGIVPLPLKGILFITSGDETGELHMEHIGGLRAFELLRKNTFRFSFVKDFGKLPFHFKACNALIEKVPMTFVKRHADISPHDFAGYIRNHINNVIEPAPLNDL